MTREFRMPPDAVSPEVEEVADAPATSASMSDAERAAFFALADRFLAVANEAAVELGPGRVSAAMMFATTRFNAFTAQTQGMPPGEADEDAVRYFRDEYVKMLRENMEQTLIAKE
ncbi:MAG: DUF3144 domain-containing protein [Paracoccaceae bacterium]